MYIYDGHLLVTVFFRDKDWLVCLAYTLLAPVGQTLDSTTQFRPNTDHYPAD